MPLRLVAADDAEADGGREHAARDAEQERLLRGLAAATPSARNVAPNERRDVRARRACHASLQSVERRATARSRAARREPARVPARGWRGWRPRCVRNASQSSSSASSRSGSSMRGVHERQAPRARPAARASRTNRAQRAASCHLALLPGRFEPPGVRERPGRERRVDELPDEPVEVVHDAMSMTDSAVTTDRATTQNRKYRCASGSTSAGSRAQHFAVGGDDVGLGSTVICGSASFSFMSRLPSVRQPRTADERAWPSP